MTDKPEAPEFYGGPQMGQEPTVPHSAGINARLEAAGVQQGETLDQAWRRRADMAFQKNNKDIEFKTEPVTEKTVSGHSAEKKAALKLMQSEGITLNEALERGKQDAPKKATRKSGKGA